MSYDPVRVADLEVDRRVVGILRAIFPFWGIFVIALRRRNERKSQKGLESLAEQVARIVKEAQDGARTLRMLTVWLLGLTVLNVAFVAYSVVK